MGWVWGTRRSVALKAAGVTLVMMVALGGAALGALSAPRVVQGVGIPNGAAKQAAEPARPGLSIVGVVLTKQGNVLTVRTLQGKVGTLRLGPHTIVRRGRQPATLADIQEGDQLAAVGIPQPGLKPPVMDARVIILRPGRATIGNNRPIDADARKAL